MDCKEFRESADRYIDGELSREAMTSAIVHLEECASCRRVVRELLGLRRAVQTAVARHQPPPDLVNNIHLLIGSPWRRLMPRVTRHFAPPDTTRTDLPLWKSRVAVPAPVFILLLVVLVTLGVWAASMRRATLLSGEAPGEPKRTAAAVPAPARSPEGGLDLTSFDRGERASIYKVRRPDQGARQ